MRKRVRWAVPVAQEPAATSAGVPGPTEVERLTRSELESMLLTAADFGPDFTDTQVMSESEAAEMSEGLGQSFDDAEVTPAHCTQVEVIPVGIDPARTAMVGAERNDGFAVQAVTSADTDPGRIREQIAGDCAEVTVLRTKTRSVATARLVDPAAGAPAGSVTVALGSTTSGVGDIVLPLGPLELHSLVTHVKVGDLTVALTSTESGGSEPDHATHFALLATAIEKAQAG